jgi:hypothetical protein
MQDTNKKNPYPKWIIAILFILIITLPFHYVPSALTVFPKENLSFSYTIITPDDLDKLVERYYNCGNGFEQLSIRNEPLFRKLSERGILNVRR